MTTATTTRATKKTAPMRDIYDRLKALGFKKNWLKLYVLPEWWEDDLAKTPSARSEIEIFLSRMLGVELATLRNPDVPLEFADAPRARFKRHANSSDENLKLVRALGSRLGSLAAAACQDTPTSSAEKRLSLSTLSSQDVRGKILESGARWIGLKELLDFCWAQGIPVIHATLPQGYKKHDGMALCPHGRPVIITFDGNHSPALQAFTVAHELGHHVLGHVGANGEILDDKIERADTDEEEFAANRFAVELLLGLDEKIRGFRYNRTWPKAEVLAKQVTQFGGTHSIHPGVLLMNLCHLNPPMRPLAMGALKVIEQGEDAFGQYADKMSILDNEAWNDDEAVFFERLTSNFATALS